MTPILLARARGLLLGLALLLSLVVSSAATAQTDPSSAVTRAPDLAVPTTRVLAIGRFAPGATPTAWRPYLDEEVRQTVELYLAGKIEQWWVKPDQTGVVFLFDADNAKDVQALLDVLPLGRAGLMQFELIPLGPLSPLRLLLRQPSR